MEIAYSLASEELRPRAMVDAARRAEETGFRSVWLSDHFHPWIDRQGQSPFVWSVIGGIAATTELRVGTAVTCPLIRTHPAIVAQAAATSADMLGGRFSLGVGSGEALNEHVLGDRWPPADVRLEMLEEAVAVMRKLWEGGQQSHEGKHYRVENARLYTLPDELVPVMVSGFGAKSAALGGRIGDGYIGSAPDADLLRTFDEAGGAGKPKFAGIKVCWANDEAAARRTAFELWPNLGLPGQLAQELALPALFEQAVELVEEEQVTGMVPCGPDPEHHLDTIRKYADAGYDAVFVHQIGPDQEGFLRFYGEEVLPKV
ncbi:MAG: TIGR03557 family F420-dependent LLM class oxidoreductase [Acidimicrobiia bacterium]